ncbi:MAG: hypothetical protein GQ567_06120 [Methanosarcinales archaeon]|nr:hypothetical protein [Methanosarcinales archaeon]
MRFEFVPESERIAYYAACDIAWGISILLDDMGEAALRGKRARKLVERHFTRDMVADSTIDVYDDVVANGRKY